jgi:hypothetical protein
VFEVVGELLSLFIINWFLFEIDIQLGGFFDHGFS